jgi:hypothetical protein
MIRYVVAILVALAALAAPAEAQERWRHQDSGISLPRRVGEMRLSQEQDASGGGNYDVILQYGDGNTPVTVYVYRSAYPNAAMWFERVRLAMNEHVGTGGAVAPRSFTLGGASAPNGLREETTMRGGATGVALAQIGEWIVKLRVSSSRLDQAGVAARIDQLLAAFEFARPTPAPLPLAVPGACEGGLPMRGERIGDVSSEALAGAAAFGIVGYAQARGRSGLAAEPGLWCRVTRSELPPRYGTLYRRRDGTGWVALFGDSGRAAAAWPSDVPGERVAYLWASTPASTQVVALYDALPDPNQALAIALPVVVGQGRGLVEIGTEGPRPGTGRKN